MMQDYKMGMARHRDWGNEAMNVAMAKQQWQGYNCGETVNAGWQWKDSSNDGDRETMAMGR
jgi:hypothetical protein